MKSKQGSFIDDAATMLLSRVLVQLAGLATSIIIARAVGAEGRGMIAAIVVVPQLILTMAAAGIGSATAIHIGKKTWAANEIIQTLILLAATSAIFGAALSFAWIVSFPVEGYTPALITAAVLIVPGAVCYHYTAGAFLGLRQVPTFAIKSWAPGIGKLILTIVFVGFLGLGPVGAVSATALSGTIVGGFLLWKLMRYAQVKPRWRPEISRALTSTGFSLSFVFLLMILVYRSNIFLIQKFGNLAELGHYSVGTMLAELLWQIPTVISALLLARSAVAKDGAKFSRDVIMIARMTLLLGFVVSVFIAILAPMLVELLYGQEFIPSADIIRALLPGTLAIMVFKILRQDLSGKGRPWVALWVIFPMLFAVLAAGPFIIPLYGAVGAAHTTSVIYVTGTGIFLLVYSRVTSISLSEIVRYRKSDFVRVQRTLTKKLKKTLQR